MSESDTEFVERMVNEWGEWAGSPANARLFALARRGAAVQWRPIEEAPTEGQRVLLLTPPYGAGSGHWDNGWKSHFCLNKEAQPTHWMPLPPPPAGETSDE